MGKPKVSLILVPVDFSEITPRVLDYARLIAAQNQARLLLMHVVNVPPLTETGTWLDQAVSPTIEQDLRAQLRTGAEQRLAGIRAECEREGVTAEVEVREGVPNGEIVKCAEERGADLIVMGSLGHSVVSHFLIGSTAERVVRRSRLTVLCVKPEVDKTS